MPIGTLIVTLESDNGGVLDLDAISDYLAQRQVRISEIERTTEKEVIA